jgi:DNA-binding IclR family transcriptional regulator
MSPTSHLIRRVRGEFLEMPGLRLRLDQAQRLWNMDRSSCELLLSSLVEAKFLRRYSDDAYGLPSAN